MITRIIITVANRLTTRAQPSRTPSCYRNYLFVIMLLDRGYVEVQQVRGNLSLYFTTITPL